MSQQLLFVDPCGATFSQGAHLWAEHERYVNDDGPGGVVETYIVLKCRRSGCGNMKVLMVRGEKVDS